MTRNDDGFIFGCGCLGMVMALVINAAIIVGAIVLVVWTLRWLDVL